MAKITFIEHDGTPHCIEVADGTSLMQGAVSHNVPGIEADCGGAMTCGTCLVSIPPEWLEKAGRRSDEEAQMLQFLGCAADNVRLSCQLIASPDLDGLCVHVPESQG
ncbi:MAG: 2Fe-2S iron-sulfur cluster-binding protein [Rhodocyclaceae bacterium]|jgi:2Fe-2S ferredoxin|nr:2Fe-2S iron-sulfur cluster-binding protein [Rhodocyclaceae bacterium]